jgi:hypothetical protein
MLFHILRNYHCLHNYSFICEVQTTGSFPFPNNPYYNHEINSGVEILLRIIGCTNKDHLIAPDLQPK